MESITKHFANVGVLLLVVLLLLVGSVAARPTPQESPPTPQAVQSPSSTLFSYQGQLLDAAGDPIDGAAEMTFSLYHQDEGGDAFWTEAYTGTQAIAVADGLFHTLLGSLTSINTANLTDTVYLELTVNEETLTPRELLAPVPVADTLSLEATTLGDLTANGTLVVKGSSDGPEIEWSTGTERHWNIDQYGTNPNLRFFTMNPKSNSDL